MSPIETRKVTENGLEKPKMIPSEGQGWEDTIGTLWDTPEDFRKKVAVRNPHASHL